MSSPRASTNFLAAAGVKVISAVTVEEKVKAVITPPAPPPAADVGGIVGGVVGGIGGALMLIGIIAGVMKMRKNAKTTYPA